MTTTGATAAAWALAAATFAAMVLAGGAVRATLVLVLVAAQVALHLAATRWLGPSSWRRVAVLWSVQASLTWLVAGAATTPSVLVYIGTGLVFALVAEVVLRAVGRFAAHDAVPGPADTAPLPVIDGEG
jgi:hypothetical protein